MSDGRLVFISPMSHRKSGANITPKYHSADCHFVTEDYAKVTKEFVKLGEFDACSYCMSEEPIKQSQSFRNQLKHE